MSGDLGPINLRMEWQPAGDRPPLVLVDPTSWSVLVTGGSGMDAPAYSFPTTSTPGVDGVQFGEVVAFRSQVTVPVFVRTTSRDQMRQVRGAFAAAFNPKLGPGRLVVSRDFGDGSNTGTSRYVTAMYRGGLEGDGRGGVDRWWRLDLQFECKDPFWYSIDPIQATWRGKPNSAPFFPFRFPFRLSESGVDPMDPLVVNGDADSWPAFDLKGPFSRIRVAPAGGPTFWEVRRQTGPSEMLRLSTKPGEESLRLLTTTDGVSWVDAGNAWSTLHQDSWFTPLQFQGDLSISADGTTRDTTVSLSAPEAWFLPS